MFEYFNSESVAVIKNSIEEFIVNRNYKQFDSIVCNLVAIEQSKNVVFYFVFFENNICRKTIAVIVNNIDKKFVII